MHIQFEIILRGVTHAERISEITKSSWIFSTFGSYFISVANQKLFQYSDPYRNANLKNSSELLGTGCVNDYVGKLYLAFVRAIPYAMEVVPADLTHYMSSINDAQWETKCKSWYEDAELHLEPDDPQWEVYGDAMEWRSARMIDCDHLTNAPRFWLWREKDQIAIEWNNREIVFDKGPVYTAEIGRETNTIDEFSKSFLRFESRLLSNVFPPCTSSATSIRSVSDEELAIAIRNQILRSRENCFVPTVTDWDKVRRALNVIIERW